MSSLSLERVLCDLNHELLCQNWEHARTHYEKLPRIVHSYLAYWAFVQSDDPSKHSNPNFGSDLIKRDITVLSRITNPAAKEQGLTYIDYLTRQIVSSHFGEDDPIVYLEASGDRGDLHRFYGAQSTPSYCTFRVYAPRAQKITLVLEDEEHLMEQFLGTWHTMLRGDLIGKRYHYKILGADGIERIKADPFSFDTTGPPNFESRVSIRPTDFPFENKPVFPSMSTGEPFNILEVHLQSWMRKGEKPLEAAHNLARHCNSIGFNTINFMPLATVSAQNGYGYDALLPYAFSTIFESLYEFCQFVDVLHGEGLRVFLDVSLYHFSPHAKGQVDFDGTDLFGKKEEPKTSPWGLALYDPSAPFIRSYLISLLDYLSFVDGFRIDAVHPLLDPSAMRDAAHIPDWDPDAFSLLKACGRHMRTYHPHTTLIAENFHPDSRHHTELMQLSGRWDNGAYHFRECFKKNALTPREFIAANSSMYEGGRVCTYSTHDDPLSTWAAGSQHLIHAATFMLPGPSHIFMGDEFSRQKVWEPHGEFDRNQEFHEDNRKKQLLVRDLCALSEHTALKVSENNVENFSWSATSDEKNQVVAFRRGDNKDKLFTLFNFSYDTFPEYDVYFEDLERVKGLKLAREIFNTDHTRYGGSGHVNSKSLILLQNDNQDPIGYRIKLAPRCALVIEELF